VDNIDNTNDDDDDVNDHNRKKRRRSNDNVADSSTTNNHHRHSTTTDTSTTSTRHLSPSYKMTLSQRLEFDTSDSSDTTDDDDDDGNNSYNHRTKYDTNGPINNDSYCCTSDEIESYNSVTVQLPDTDYNNNNNNDNYDIGNFGYDCQFTGGREVQQQKRRRTRVYNIIPARQWKDVSSNNNNASTITIPKPDSDIFDETGRVVCHRKWTLQEKMVIKSGIQKYKTDCVAIKNHYAIILRNRTNVQCKDCYRTMI
jgi:hypothetical protein